MPAPRKRVLQSLHDCVRISAQRESTIKQAAETSGQCWVLRSILLAVLAPLACLAIRQIGSQPRGGAGRLALMVAVATKLIVRGF